jgi:hypothetical protein
MLESNDKLVINIANIYKHMQTLESPLIMNKTKQNKKVKCQVWIKPLSHMILHSIVAHALNL